MQAQFPDYLDNPLLTQLSRSHKLILRLLRQRKYRTVRHSLPPRTSSAERPDWRKL